MRMRHDILVTMDESTHTTTKEQQPADTASEYYVKMLAGPVLIAALFQIVALHNTNKTTLILVAHIIIATLISIQTVQRHISWKTAAIAGGVAGAIIGFVVALYKLITDFHVVYVFNLFTEPAVTGVLDGIATGFITLIIYSIVKHIIHK